MSRTKKTAKNTVAGLLCTGISYFLSFFLQALFIRLMGLEYSGINSLFSDILKILNLADLGFNNAILFRLYKTISNGDDEATEVYLSLYRKICYAIGIIVALLGLLCVPFLGSFVKTKPMFPEPLWSIYLIILATSVANHFINYRSILLIAKQDRYIATLIEYACIFLKHTLQIIVLVLFKNIYLYLLVGLLSVCLQGTVVGVVSAKKYGLSWRSSERVSDAEVKEITKDVGALAVFKVCRTINGTLDTLLISKYIAVAETAIYGSVVVLTSGLSTLIDTLNDGMIASVGDLNATGDKDGVENVLKGSIHIMYLLYGTCAAVLVPFMRPFLIWWIGYSLPDICIYVLLFNFYSGGLNANVSMFRNSMGLYRKGWKRPAFTVVVNCVTSYLLIQEIGILGAFIGTTIANVTTMLWYDPLVVYRHGLNRSPAAFFTRYLMYLLFVLCASFSTYYLGKVLPEATTFISLVWHGCVYLFVSLFLLITGGSLFETQKGLLKKLRMLVFQKIGRA